MPNPKEATCPVCKKPGVADVIREKRKGLVSMYTVIVCIDDKMFWTSDMGWRAIPKKMRTEFIHAFAESLPMNSEGLPRADE